MTKDMNIGTTSYSSFPETSVEKNNLTKDREQELIRQQRDLIYRMRALIWSVIQWNDEYRYLNNLSGDPYWVTTAYDLFMDSRPK